MAKRSYVPRHAAPTEPFAPGARKAATVLAAGVGVAAATTALATPAIAKSHHGGAAGVWDRVASCESGQRWHISTGNGYYGGLQFTSSTWHGYHGGKYASRADHASRMEQIQVARRVLKSQGRDAWPVCGPRAGLTKNSGDATGSSLPNDASNMGGSSGHHSKKHHSTKHKSHHGTHKSRTRHGDTYVVKRGDTLSGIARKKHVHGGWHALYRANRSHMHNPNVLHIGQHLLIP